MTSASSLRVLALAGGVGGANLAAGLSHLLLSVRPDFTRSSSTNESECLTNSLERPPDSTTPSAMRPESRSICSFIGVR